MFGIKLYREAKHEDIARPGLSKYPDFWAIAIPFWINVFKHPHDYPFSFNISHYGRRWFQLGIVFRNDGKKIFHKLAHEIGPQTEIPKLPEKPLTEKQKRAQVARDFELLGTRWALFEMIEKKFAEAEKEHKKKGMV